MGSRVTWWPLVIRRVSGHSMMPILPPGTLVVGSKWYRRVKPGNVFIFSHEGREKIKRIQTMQTDGQLFVIGEHLFASTDSRHFGHIETTALIAKVIWPSVKPRL